MQLKRFLLSISIILTAIAPIFADVSIPSDTEIFTHQDIADKSIIFDLHCDTVYRFYRLKTNNSFKYTKTPKLQVTLKRLQKAGVKALFFTLWTPPGKSAQHADYMIRIFERMLKRYSEGIAFAGSYADLQKNIADGKISAFLSLENGKPIGEDIDKLDYFYEKGVRYIGLTWNSSNKIADAAVDKNKPHDGLSSFGVAVIKKMNEIGMIIDVSHSSDKTVKDILKVSKDPIIASHSNCNSLRKHPRNLKDELIEGICNSGGVIGVNFYTKFLVSKGIARVSHVADNIDHIVKTGGIDCAAIGSDYDGMPRPARGLENIMLLENLTNELIKRGYTREDVEKILGLNSVRVLKRVVK